MPTDPHDYAQPTPAPYRDPNSDEMFYPEGGLTKREHFAALAMQGILAHPSAAAYMDPPEVARGAKECADALINALNEGPPDA